MYFFLLSVSTPVFNKLSAYDRIWLYKKLQLNEPLSYANKRKLLVHLTNNDVVSNDEELDKKLNAFEADFYICEAFHYDFAPECCIKLITLEDEKEMYEQLNIENLEQLLQWEFMKMVKTGVRIKKCENCGKYFSVDDNKNNYCDRKAEDNKTCFEVGPNRRFLNQKKNDTYYTTYRKACNKNTARAKTQKITQNALENWRKEAKKGLMTLNSNQQKTVSDFING